MNKYIQTKKIKKWEIIDLLKFAIPLILFLYFTIGIIHKERLIEAPPENLPQVLIALALIDLLISLFITLPLLLIWNAVSRYMKKSALSRSTFRAVADIKYYRDKLTELTPVQISMITDLQIEKTKDVTAILLKYILLGIIKINNNQVQICAPDHPSLMPSDHALLEQLSRTPFLSNDLFNNLGPWEKLVIQEADATEYFNAADKAKSSTRILRNGCLSGCLFPILIFILIGIIVVNGGNTLTNDLSAMQSTLSNNMDLLHALVANAGFRNAVLISLLVIFGFFTSIYSPIAAIVRIVTESYNLARTPVIRTAEGEQMAEYVYGMKNFLHDFSSLSEADKDQLILWDDFLIYAVVLEENERIIHEIFQKRNLDFNWSNHLRNS